MGSWTKQDLAWASDHAYQLLAQLFNSIEHHPAWPSTLTKARAVFLSKDPSDTGNPKAYRILKITSVIYRLWATIRVKHLDHWVRGWAEPEMYAGIPGAGAEEGWYLTQLEMEHHTSNNTPITAASIDIYKCFDQVVRPLVYHLTDKAGMPKGILNAYVVSKKTSLPTTK